MQHMCAALSDCVPSQQGDGRSASGAKEGRVVVWGIATGMTTHQRDKITEGAWSATFVCAAEQSGLWRPRGASGLLGHRHRDASHQPGRPDPGCRRRTQQRGRSQGPGVGHGQPCAPSNCAGWRHGPYLGRAG